MDIQTLLSKDRACKLKIEIKIWWLKLDIQWFIISISNHIFLILNF